MSDTMITPEDRERLAKSKFKEWFDECLEGSIESIIEKTGKKTDPSQPGDPSQPEEPPAPPSQPQQKVQRRSLLETCLSQTFGF